VHFIPTYTTINAEGTAQLYLEAQWAALNSSVGLRFSVYCQIHSRALLIARDQASNIDGLSPTD
jgi:hypothetical protein